LRVHAAADDACVGKSTTGAPGADVAPVTVIGAAIIAPATQSTIAAAPT
jgi:hypothetical protein